MAKEKEAVYYQESLKLGEREIQIGISARVAEKDEEKTIQGMRERVKKYLAASIAGHVIADEAEGVKRI